MTSDGRNTPDARNNVAAEKIENQNATAADTKKVSGPEHYEDTKKVEGPGADTQKAASAGAVLPDSSAIDAMRAAVQSRAAERAPAADEAPAMLTETFVIKCEQENFSGDGKIYRHLNRGKVLFVHQTKHWLHWAGHFWAGDANGQRALWLVEEVAQEYRRVAYLLKQQEDDEATEAKDKKSIAYRREALLARAKRCRGPNRSAVLEYVHSGGKESLAIEGPELNADPWLMACSNGVLNLRTFELRPGLPKDFITLSSPTEWQGLNADSSAFEKFLMQIFSDDAELVAFVLRFLGVALLGYQREHKFLVLFGEGGRNGKDTLMGILRDVLGRDLFADVPPETFVEQNFVRDPDKPSPLTVGLNGKRIIYASESSRRHKFSSETIKRLTGGGSITSRNLNQGDMQEIPLSYNIILLTNELPAAPADDEAFWDRLCGIELKRRFVDSPNPDNPDEFPKDPDLRQKLAEGKSGVLAAIARGLKDYMDNGGLRPPVSVQSFKESYRQSEDVIGRFLADCCKLYHDEKEREEHKIQATTLRDCFEWWYSENVKRKAPSRSFFSDSMKKKKIEVRKISSNFYMGVEITLDALDEWNAWKSEKEKNKS